MKYLAKNIKFLRGKKQWSQETLAKKMDVKRSSIAAYESKNVNPKLEFIVSFSKLFDISISDLIEKDLEVQLGQSNGSSPSDQGGIEPSHIRLEDISMQNAQPEDLDIDDKDSVRQFVRRSIRIRKMLEGFKAFYRLKLENLRHGSQEVNQLAPDVENFILLMEHLVAHNETVIRAISERQDLDWRRG